jgi:hypothetical protein
VSGSGSLLFELGAKALNSPKEDDAERVAKKPRPALSANQKGLRAPAELPNLRSGAKENQLDRE